MENLLIKNAGKKCDFGNEPIELAEFLHVFRFEQANQQTLLAFFRIFSESWIFWPFCDVNFAYFPFFDGFCPKSPTSPTQLVLQVAACGKYVNRREQRAKERCSTTF